MISKYVKLEFTRFIITLVREIHLKDIKSFEVRDLIVQTSIVVLSTNV